MSQFGLVANVVSKPEGLISFNIGYAYNKTNNLSQDILIQGISNSSSMADYWADLGNRDGGTLYSDLEGPEGIAFDAWVMDTITGSGGRGFGTVYSNYGDNPPSRYGQTIRRIIYNDGYLAENSISFGGNYSNKLYFGATFGITTLRYISHYEHLESTDVPLASQFRNFTYVDHYEDNGTGYNFKLGAIFRPVEAVRIGLAFHSPIWYKIDEYYYNDITSNFTDGGHYEANNDPMRFNYALASPYRLLGGVGIQIKKVAILSADYEYVDYSSARFSQTGDGYDYSSKNDEIRNTLKGAHNFRFGGEYRIDKIYLRGGYGLYGKPFNENEDNADLKYNTISGGIGFRDRNFLIDFGYQNLQSSQNYVLYPVDLGVEPAMASLKTTQNVFTLTFGYKFGI
jgi:long-subunit fatty acid transport protein